MSYSKDYGTAFKKKDKQVRITLSEFRDILYLHIREYDMDWDTGSWFPTKSGYAMLADEIDSVIELLKQASEDIAKFNRKDKNQSEFDFM